MRIHYFSSKLVGEAAKCENRWPTHPPRLSVHTSPVACVGIFFSHVFRSKNQENRGSACIIMQQVQFYNMFVILFRIKSHLMKEFEINNTPYGLRVMATDPPTNKSVGSCPKDIKTAELNARVAKYESIWMGGNPDWTALQLHLGKTADTLFEHVRYFRVFSNVSSKENSFMYIKPTNADGNGVS